ncbi:MAG TPA: S8 family serine peptidase [Thiohalobacter sp.]|nr:S8 family serine peptidase [Thiohalobacter sp.]
MIAIWKRLVLPCLLTASCMAATAADPTRILLRLEAGMDERAFLQDLGRRFEPGFSLQRRLGRTLVVRLAPALPRAEAETLVGRIGELAGVVYAQLPPGRMQPQFVPNDALYPDQWHLFEAYGIDAQNAWDRTRGGSRVVIAQVDTGILAHEDLDAARILPGYDFVSNEISANDGDGSDPDPTDPGDAVAENECPGGNPARPKSSWHGLLVAGVMLATADNARGIAGVDHRARLLPVRAFGKCGGDFLDILAGMSWAAGLPVTGVPANPNPADVINLSFSGSDPCDPAIQDIIDQIRARGVVLVAAAGNAGSAGMSEALPANCDGVIAVTATNRAGDRAAYSNHGAGIDLAAPGGDGLGLLPTTDNDGDVTPGNDDYRSVSGTSFSAAQVSAAVALMRALDPAVTPDTVTSLLINSARPFPAGSTCTTAICGAGILDLDAVLLQTSSSGGVVVDDGGGGGGCVLATDRRPDIGLALLLLAVLGVRFACRSACLNCRSG